VIRFVIRWVFRLSAVAAVLLLLLGAGLYFLKDELLRQWLVFRLGTVTGLDTRLDGLRSDLRAGAITLTGLQIVNAPEFGGSALLTVPDLHLQLDTDALTRREFRFRLARLHLAEFNVVRNEQGRTNILALMESVSRQAGTADAAVVSPPGLEFAGIDTLDLTVGALRFAQLGPGGGTREIRVGLTHEIVRNVRTVEDLMPLILRVAFREAAAGLRLDFDPRAPRPTPPSLPGPVPGLVPAPVPVPPASGPGSGASQVPAGRRPAAPPPR
jgi:hypothetical protein